MSIVNINGRRVRLSPSMVIGKGGEADIYRLSGGTEVLKLFKQPTDPDYAGQPEAQQGAVQRIATHQTKLPEFPTGLPPEVVSPRALAYDTPGHIAGYTMQFIDGMDVLMDLGRRDYREAKGLDGNHVLAVFRQLAKVVDSLHSASVVVGDFSDLNVLTNQSGQLALVDADSMQFGRYLCQTFTNRFVDPLRCDAGQLELVRPHDMASDWYAYFVMLLQSLLYVEPYGGVHRPKLGRRLQHDKRVLQRITVLSPEVVYPKPALPLSSLPDDLLQYMEQVFVHDARGRFPAALLDSLRWTTCTTCGFTHARRRCPNCQMPGAPKPVMTVRGNVTAKRVFRTEGVILQAVFHGGQLRYLFEENGEVCREDGQRVMSACDVKRQRVRIQRDTTVAADATALTVYGPQGQVLNRFTIEQYRARLPVFDTNARTAVWVQNSQLVSAGRHGPTYIGDVLSGQTLVWLGEQFGLGFYQAGRLTRTFVFRPGLRGLNDQVDIGVVAGQIVDATCVFATDKAWLLLAISDGGVMKHKCFVVDAAGAIVAKAEVEQGDDSWLGRSIRGHMASGESLFVATDDGIVRVGCGSGVLDVESTFPDTEPFVDAQTYLVPGPGGIHAVSHHTIVLLTMV